MIAPEARSFRDHGGFVRWPKSAQHAASACGRLTFHAENVLDCHRNTRQWANRFAGLTATINCTSLSQYLFWIKMHEDIQSFEPV